MARVVAFEQVHYNGYDFPTESIVSVNAAFQLDQSQRVVIYTLYTVTVEALIADHQQSDIYPTDDNETFRLPEIRQKLSQQGQAFYLIGSGFGNIAIGNTEGALAEVEERAFDVAYGPRVTSLQWNPLGLHAARVRWTCELRVKECNPTVNAENEGFVDAEKGFFIDESTELKFNRLIEFSYRTSFSRDMHGYLSRTVSGTVSIAAARKLGTINSSDHIDRMLERFGSDFFPSPVEGFRRDNFQTEVSSDGRSANFTYTDVEMPTSLPAGVVECRASHSTSTQGPAMMRYTGTIRASYVLRKDIPKSAVWTYFFRLVLERLRAQHETAEVTAFIPLALSMEDSDIYGRHGGNLSFTYAYMIKKGEAGGGPVAGAGNPFKGLSVMPKASGLWGPVPTSGDEDWKHSMETVFSQRGSKGLFLPDDSEQPIVSLCVASTPFVKSPDIFRVAPAGVGLPELRFLAPRKEDAYLRYDTLLEVQIYPGTIFVRPTFNAATAGLLAGILGGLGAGGAGAAGAAAGVAFGDATLYNDASIAATGGIIGSTTTVKPAMMLGILNYIIVSFHEPAKLPHLTKVAGVQEITEATAPDIVQSYHQYGAERIGDHWGVPVWRIRGRRPYMLKVAPGFTGLGVGFPPNYYVNNVYTEKRLENAGETFNL